MIPGGCSHRISLAWIDGVVKGGIHVMSMYLHDSVGLNDANKYVLEQAAIALNLLTGPWILFTDWNLPPERLAQSGWLKIVDGVVFATT